LNHLQFYTFNAMEMAIQLLSSHTWYRLPLAAHVKIKEIKTVHKRRHRIWKGDNKQLRRTPVEGFCLTSRFHGQQ